MKSISIRGFNADYWESIDGSVPRTIRFERFEDGGQTIFGYALGKPYRVAKERRADGQPGANSTIN